MDGAFPGFAEPVYSKVETMKLILIQFFLVLYTLVISG